MTRNYELVYYVTQKCVNYRDTGVSKNVGNNMSSQIVLQRLVMVNKLRKGYIRQDYEAFNIL